MVPVFLTLAIQAASTISGQVVDFQGKPVEGARVGTVTGNRVTVTTGPEGRFELVGVSPGMVSVAARKGTDMANELAAAGAKSITIRLKSMGGPYLAAVGMPPEAKPGTPAPAIQASDLWINGKPSEQTGRIRVLHFWGMWCPPCLEEIPDVVAFHEQSPQVDLVSLHQMIGDQARLERFAREHRMTWAVVKDGDRMGESMATAYAYGIRAVPTFVVVDQRGMVDTVTHDLGVVKFVVLRLAQSESGNDMGAPSVP